MCIKLTVKFYELIRFWKRSGQIITYLTIGIYSWPLMLKVIKSLTILYHAFRSNGYGVNTSEFFAFGPSDARFRPWYNKIARDYQSQGRFGYVWDDGLGMALGTRIYNNFATYYLLQKLSTRRLMAFGYSLLILSYFLLIGFQLGFFAAAVFTIFMAASPLILGAYTHRGKPEVFWWGFVLPFLYSAFSGKVLITGLMWSFFAFVNTAIAIMMVLFLGPAMLISLPIGDLLLLSIASLPGILKSVLRFYAMWRSSFFSNLLSEQSRLAKTGWLPRAREICWLLPFTFCMVASILLADDRSFGVVLMLTVLSWYYINFRVIYINDPLSFHMALWSVGCSYAAVVQSLPGLIAILLMFYASPQLCNYRILREIPATRTHLWKDRLEHTFAQICSYPFLSPVALPKPELLMQFFAKIPDGSRIIFESHGDARTDQNFRYFWQWSEEFLPARKIDLANEIYTRVVVPSFANRYLERVNAEKMHAEEMRELCDVLGVSFVVTHTPETKKLLQSSGFRVVSNVDLARLEEFRTVVDVPPVRLSLLQNPDNVSVIEPSVPWERNGNEFEWMAVEGETYLIRYRYSPQFVACQGKARLAVTPFLPIENSDLVFMKVQAPSNGAIVLRFRKKWL